MTDLKVVQERLIALGYDVSRAGADGILGRSTVAAVANVLAADWWTCRHNGASAA